MWRIPVGLLLIVLWVAGVDLLMVQNAHFLLAMFGAGCGAAVGWAFAGRRGLLAGSVLGFVATLAYLPLWFAFDLPPLVDINL